jgi:lipoate-protein ligase A
MTIPTVLQHYPLASYFLSGYLARNDDPTNFPPAEFPDLFQRYENLFKAALDALGISQERIRRLSEFNFDSDDANNLEAGIGVLRAVEALNLLGFRCIKLLSPPGADIYCEKNGQKVCCEAKTITKQSVGRRGFFLADQLFEKIAETLPKARKQLESTARRLQCEVKFPVYVMNWLEHSIVLDQENYQQIVSKLESSGQLLGLDRILFVTKMGERRFHLQDSPDIAAMLDIPRPTTSQ